VRKSKLLISVFTVLVMLFGMAAPTFADEAVGNLSADGGSGIALITRLEDGATIRGSKKAFDLWATDANGKKIPAADITVLLNGNRVWQSWDDSSKTSYTLRLQEGENTVSITAESGGETKTITYLLHHTPVKDGDPIGSVAFSVEVFTIGCGYLVEPQIIEIYEGQNAAHSLNKVLKESGLKYKHWGTVNEGFYLSHIMDGGTPLGQGESGCNDPDLGRPLDLHPRVPEILLKYVKPNYEAFSGVSLGEFDFTGGSGWMYMVNHNPPNLGFDQFYLDDGDVVRIQFTLDYGKDIGAGSALGGGDYSSYYPIANKDNLTRLVAEINSSENKDALLADAEVQELYEAAMNALVDLSPGQEAVDSAFEALNRKLNAEAAAVMDLIGALPDAEAVALADQEEIAAARQAYDRLLEKQKDHVTNLDQLLAAEAALAELQAVKGVEDKIAAIGTVTLESRPLIDEARAAYAALPAAQAKLVANYRTLTAAEYLYALLKGGQVYRIAGDNRYDTSAETALNAVAVNQNGAETVIIARGDDQGDFADALAASYLAGQEKAPILLTRRGSLPQEIEEAVKQLGAKKAYVLGGELAVSQTVVDKLEELGLETERLQGATRYATAAAIAAKGGQTDTAVVVSGSAPADSLAAGPLAYGRNYPILLVDKNRVPSETKKAVKDLGIQKIIVIGGENAVSRAVYSELQATERYAGQSRIETSLDVAEKLFTEAKDYSVVGCLKLADAVGAAVCGNPIIYVKNDVSGVEDYLTEAAAADTNFTIFGGRLAVGKTVENALKQLLQ